MPPPALNPVLAGDALAGRISSEFANTYQQDLVSEQAMVAQIMDIDMGYAEKLTRTKTHAYYETPPYPRRWADGHERSLRAFRARQFQSTAYRYEDAVEWMRLDALYSQIDLVGQARRAGALYASLHDRIAAQIISAGADLDLLPAVPNAADGAALYSATDGDAADRFGVAGGNIVTGTGVTAADRRTDFFSAVERIARFLDPQGQPLFPSTILTAGTWIIAGRVAELDVFIEAFQAQTVQSASTNAGVSNILLAGGVKLQTWAWNRLPAGSTNVYVFLAHPSVMHKPIFHIQDEGLEVTEQTARSGSDRALYEDVEGVYWRDVRTYGVGPAYSTVLIQQP